MAKTIIAPIERVKFLFVVKPMLCRQTSNRKFTYRMFLSDSLHIVNKHGVLNLWRGNMMNIARVFPHAAVVKLSTLRTSRSSITSEIDSTPETDLLCNKSSSTSAEPLQVWHRSPSLPLWNSWESDSRCRETASATTAILVPSRSSSKEKDYWDFIRVTEQQRAE